MSFQSLVELAPWTTIAQICNLLLQMYLFKRFLFKPIKNILAKRQEEIDGLYDAANTARSEAEQSKEDYERHLATAQDEAAEITARAAKAAQSRADELVSSAKAEAASIRAKAESDIQLERKKAVNDMKNEISDLAVEIAGKVAAKEIDEKAHEALIGKFIDELGETT